MDLLQKETILDIINHTWSTFNDNDNKQRNNKDIKISIENKEEKEEEKEKENKNLKTIEKDQEQQNNEKNLNLNFDLITADGSLPCPDNPSEQETIVFPLIYCQTVTALNVLHHGGTFILKIFTTFEHFSISLLYILCKAFEDLRIVKPDTSKEGNSEVYVIGLRYRGLPKEVLQKMFDKIEGGEKSLLTDQCILPLDSLPPAFIDSVVECSAYFARFQSESVEEHLRTFQALTPQDKKNLHKMQMKVALEFISRYQVKRIRARDKLASNQNIHQKSIESSSRRRRRRRGSVHQFIDIKRSKEEDQALIDAEEQKRRKRKERFGTSEVDPISSSSQHDEEKEKIKDSDDNEAHPTGHFKRRRTIPKKEPNLTIHVNSRKRRWMNNNNNNNKNDNPPSRKKTSIPPL